MFLLPTCRSFLKTCFFVFLLLFTFRNSLFAACSACFLVLYLLRFPGGSLLRSFTFFSSWGCTFFFSSRRYLDFALEYAILPPTTAAPIAITTQPTGVIAPSQAITALPRALMENPASTANVPPPASANCHTSPSLSDLFTGLSSQ